MNKLDRYHISTQNITFDKINSTSYIDVIKYIVEHNVDNGYYKYNIPKNKKINISRNKSSVDIFFGIYSDSDCEFKININNIGLFQEGNILKNKIRFINPIILTSLLDTEIVIETSSDCYLLFSILHNELRNFFATNYIVIDKFVYFEGKISKEEDIEFNKPFFPCIKLVNYKFPSYTNYSIKDKIDSINETDEYKEKNSLFLSEKEKEYIMKDFDLLDYYITKKFKN